MDITSFLSTYFFEKSLRKNNVFSVPTWVVFLPITQVWYRELGLKHIKSKGCGPPRQPCVCQSLLTQVTWRGHGPRHSLRQGASCSGYGADLASRSLVRQDIFSAVMDCDPRQGDWSPHISTCASTDDRLFSV